MHMETNTGGGLKKVFGRMFSGESIFMNEYSAQGGTGMIAFASSFSGSIIPYHVTPGNGIIVQKRGFLAMEKGLELSVYFQKKLGKGFFGGEGLFHTRITGPGKVYIQSMPVINTAQCLTPYLNINNDNNSGGGINIRLGD